MPKEQKWERGDGHDDNGRSKEASAEVHRVRARLNGDLYFYASDAGIPNAPLQVWRTVKGRGWLPVLDASGNQITFKHQPRRALADILNSLPGVHTQEQGT